MKSKTITAWDDLVEHAPKSLKDYFDAEEKFLEENITKEDSILDVGCGTGRTVQIISKEHSFILG